MNLILQLYKIFTNATNAKALRVDYTRKIPSNDRENIIAYLVNLSAILIAIKGDENPSSKWENKLRKTLFRQLGQLQPVQVGKK